MGSLGAQAPELPGSPRVWHSRTHSQTPTQVETVAPIVPEMPPAMATGDRDCATWTFRRPDNTDPLPSFTNPGTRLSMGESMIVQEPAGSGTMDTGWAVVKYTVTGIEDGDPAVLDAYRSDDQFANATPYYDDPVGWLP